MKATDFVSVALACSLASACFAQAPPDAWAERALDHAVRQYLLLGEGLATDRFPRALDADGRLVTVPARSWVSGFYPGTLWHLAEASGDTALADRAIAWTEALAPQRLNTGTHDLGFIFVPSYGNAYRLRGDSAHRRVLLTAASSLARRFSPTVGCVKSWDFFNGPDKWRQFPVIIDNMMNLELLFEATRLGGDSAYHRMAVSHADRTLANHVRPDHSTYHVVDYDTLTGRPLRAMTSQGLADESTWARGQAWGVAGFTIAYRYTGHDRYRDAAVALYEHYARHERMPADGIPYWDFDDPGIPDVSRDASAAAVVAAALLELADYVDAPLAERYRAEAGATLQTLSAPPYLTAPGTRAGFILDHSTGHRPMDSEVDVPISYADYYYVRALTDYLASDPTPARGRGTR